MKSSSGKLLSEGSQFSEGFGWRVCQTGVYSVPFFDFSRQEKRLLDCVFSRYRNDCFLKKGVVSRENAREALKALLVRVCREFDFALEKRRARVLVDFALAHTAGFGAFDFFLQDEDLEEVSLACVEKPVFVFHRKKGWLESNCFFTSVDAVVDAVNKMARPLGRRLSFQSPRLNARLLDGSRLHASIAPVALDGVEVTIRKFSKDPFCVADLVACNTLSAFAAAFLWVVLRADVSVVVAGNTGSGKTTTLNSLFSFLPAKERFVVTEETPELNLLQRHVVRTVAFEKGVGMQDLVKDSLRMRPDRVIVGEVRSKEEVKALFDCLLAGQARGAYATMHGRSSKEALARLSSFGVSRADLQALDLLIVQRRIPVFDLKTGASRELRRVTEISEVVDGEPQVVFEYDAQSDSLNFVGKSFLLKRVCPTYGCSEKQLLKELQRRGGFLQGLADSVGRTKFDSKRFFGVVQGF
ncbi:MAG: type II/IV secretion system ATPase subunit [Candidatus Micrarchaeia archaeon]